MNELDKIVGSKNRPIGLIGFVIVALLAATYFVSPYICLGSLRDALIAGDSHELEQRIDFPAVRGSIKEQLKVAMLAGMAKDKSLQDNPFAGFAAALAPALVDNMVDASVNPSGIAYLLREGALRQKTVPNHPVTNSTSGEVLSKSFVGLIDFRVDFTSGTKVWLRYEFPMNWRVYRVEIPMDALTKP